MSESESELSINISDDLKKKNLIREETIQKETAKVKKIIDLILKTSKKNPSKLNTEKIVKKPEPTKEKKTEKK